MPSRVRTQHGVTRTSRASRGRSRRWLTALAVPIGLSKCTTFIPLLLMPLGLGVGRIAWTPLFGMAFFASMAITMALDSFARARNVAVLHRVLVMRPVQTVALVAGGVAVSLHRLPGHLPACIALGSCGAMVMGVTQACSQLDVARTLARFDAKTSNALVCRSLAVTCCALVAFAGLAWVWAALVAALMPLAYRPLIRLACHFAPPDALASCRPAAHGRRSVRRRTRPQTAAIPTGVPGIVGTTARLITRTRAALHPLSIRRSALVILLAVLAGMLAMMMARASQVPQPAQMSRTDAVTGIVCLALGMVLGLLATRRIVLASGAGICTSLSAARICLPLLTIAIAIAGLVPLAWPLAALPAVGALVTLDQGLLVVSLPFLRIDDTEEGKTLATARTSQSVGATIACGAVCFQTGQLHPLPALFLLLVLLFITFSLCLPVHMPRRDVRSGGPDVGEEPKGDFPAIPASPSAARPQDQELARDLGYYSLPISLGQLTPRQSEVYVLTMRGYSADAICERLAVSRSTINTHMQEIYRRFGVHSRQELADITGVIMKQGTEVAEMPTLPGAARSAKSKQGGAKRTGGKGRKPGEGTHPGPSTTKPPNARTRRATAEEPAEPPKAPTKPGAPT